jgi:hypothetical protein
MQKKLNYSVLTHQIQKIEKKQQYFSYIFQFSFLCWALSKENSMMLSDKKTSQKEMNAKYLFVDK